MLEWDPVGAVIALQSSRCQMSVWRVTDCEPPTSSRLTSMPLGSQKNKHEVTLEVCMLTSEIGWPPSFVCFLTASLVTSVLLCS